MKHLKDAQNFIQSGKTQEALGVIENLLALAPRNPEALRLKARILDGWGRFDESTRILQHALVHSPFSEELVRDIEARAFEEREALVYSELTPEGRCFFAHPAEVMWISAVGFMGCAGFLLMSPRWVNDGQLQITQLIAAFFVCVVLPWIALMTVHLRGIKRIYVGSQGLKICWRFQEHIIPWSSVKYAVIESDPNPQLGHLRLKLYSHESRKALIDLDISQQSPVVRARRHFVRSVITAVDTICYLGKSEPVPEFLSQTSEVPQPTPQDHASQNRLSA